MGGWYKLDADDARHLAQIAGTFTDPRSSEKRARMLLFCYSQIQSKAKPCPSFRSGIRTIAKECDVSFGTARRFVERMESHGWMVKVGSGSDSRGRYDSRTFWWIAEGWGCVQDGTHPCVQPCTHPESIRREKSAHPCVQTPETLCTHQSTEYSESASLASAGAEALSSRDDALAWYEENGLRPPTPAGAET